jgi:hypothetical protein
MLVTGCGYSQGGRSRPDPDLINREEIMSVDARNLYDVVRRLRPLWINANRRAGERSFGLSTEIVVYQGQMYLGDIDTLRQWSPSAAYSLEWLDASTASATLPGLGSRHVSGAIVIHTGPDK